MNRGIKVASTSFCSVLPSSSCSHIASTTNYDKVSRKSAAISAEPDQGWTIIDLSSVSLPFFLRTDTKTQPLPQKQSCSNLSVILCHYYFTVSHRHTRKLFKHCLIFTHNPIWCYTLLKRIMPPIKHFCMRQKGNYKEKGTYTHKKVCKQDDRFHETQNFYNKTSLFSLSLFVERCLRFCKSSSL